MNYELKNEQLTVVVNSYGAEICSIKGTDGQEYVWCGDSQYWGRHAPVLFPVVGKFKDCRFTYEGNAYEMGQHGFARDMEFELVEKKDTEIWFSLSDNQKTYEIYPLHFQLQIGYRLTENSIEVLWKVINPDKEKPLYFSIGAHPAFLCDFSSGEYSLWMDAKGDVTYGFLNPVNGLLKDEKYILELEDGFCKMHEHFFDESAYVIEDSQVSEVALIRPDGTKLVSVEFEAPVVGIWSPEKKLAPFVCIEPWYGRCDRESYDGTLENREWGNQIAPGEEFSKSYTIHIFPCGV